MKYELIENDSIHVEGRTLYRIRALVDISSLVKAGDLGGYIEQASNLSQKGKAWVGDNAQVSGSARVFGSAWVYGNAWVYGSAEVCGHAIVNGCENLLCFSGVGSAQGTLTCFRTQDGALTVTRGCFIGTAEDFLEAVKETHGDNTLAQEYRLLIEVARLRFGLTQAAG